MFTMNLYTVILVLFFSLSIMEAWDSNGVDVTLLCSEYIRCRTSLMKQQWRCGEGARKLIGRTCRLETYFNVFKRISQRYETDFTQCITREVATNFRTVNKNSIPANCSSVIPKKNEEIDCLISLNASIKRCETLRECCPVIDKCQSTDTPLLLMLKEKRADVIKGALQCRSNMSAVLKAQVTADDAAMATAILRSSDDVVKMVALFDEVSNNIRMINNNVKPVSNILIENNFTQDYHNQSENLTNISKHTIQIQNLEQKGKNLINPSFQPILLGNAHVNQTLLKNELNPEHRSERKKIQINDRLSTTGAQNLSETITANPLHIFKPQSYRKYGINNFIDNDSTSRKLERIKLFMHEGENRGHSGIYGVHERPYPSKAVDNETNIVDHSHRIVFKGRRGRFRSRIEQKKQWLPVNGSADVHTFLQHNNNKSYENMQSSQLPRAVQLLSQLSNSSSTFSRNFPTLPQTFNQSKSTDSLPDAGRRLPELLETERKQAIKLVEGGSSDTLPTMDITSQKSLVAMSSQAIFTTPTSLLFPSTQMRRSFPSPLSIVTTPLRKVSSIRKPWSNKILSVSRKNSNKNQLYRSRKANRIFTGLFPIKKYGVMKPWRASFTKNTGISDSLYNNEMHFLSNTDKLTDIAIPYRNRATSFRTPVDKSSEIPKLLLVKQNVSRTVASYQPPIKILPKPRKFRPMSPEAIYEDIITQKQLVLSTKNAEYYQERNENFEDFDSGFDKVEDSLVTFGENALPLPKKKSIKPMKHHIKSGGTGSDFDSKEMEAVINNSGTWTMEPVESGASDVIQVTERSKYFSSKNLSLPILSTTDDPLQGFTEEGKLSFSSIDSDGLQNGSDKGKDEYIDISADNHRPEIFYNKIALESDIPPQPEYTLSADTRNIKAFPSDEKVVTATRYHNLPNRTLTQHTVVPRVSDIVNSSSYPSYDDSFSVELIPLPKSFSSSSSEIYSIDDDSKTERLPNPASVTYWGQQLTPSPSLTTASPFSDYLWPLPIAQNRARQFGAKIFTRQLSRHIDDAFGSHSSKESTNMLSDKYKTINVLGNSQKFNLTSCELYTSCLYNLEQQEKICNDTKREGRLMPGLPRRRVGLCNRQLVPHYLELDAGFRQLEADFRVCVQETMNTKTFQNLVMSSSCFQPSSSLPSLSSSESCSQKLSIIKNYCTKLAICCPIAQSCRSEVDQSPLAHHTRVRRVTLYEAAAKCQIKSYNEYKKRVKGAILKS